jgi:membrane protease subunit HflK
MSWNNNNGGPWGPSDNKSGGGNNPWTRKGTPNSGPPSSNQSPPPDLDKFFSQLGTWYRRMKAQSGGPLQLGFLALCAVFIFWLLSGFYQVGASQAGVVMRYGAFQRVELPGLHYHAPYPIEDVLLPNVTSQNQIEIGFRSDDHGDNSGRVLPEESMMLTQDENIINVQFTVFWRVSDIQKFLFEIRDPETTIKMAAESMMREVIGQNKLQYELTDGRGEIANEARDRLQKLMDGYNAGVIISEINLQTVAVPDEVKAAFQDVVNARLDQERFQNEAESHANKVIPEAKGEASKITQQAMAYRDQKIAIAKGEADRFKEVLEAYSMSRDVTSKRLYLEMMESVLGNAHKIILDKSASGTMSYLPLQDLLKPKSAPAEGVSR